MIRALKILAGFILLAVVALLAKFEWAPLYNQFGGASASIFTGVLLAMLVGAWECLKHIRGNKK